MSGWVNFHCRGSAQSSLAYPWPGLVSRPWRGPANAKIQVMKAPGAPDFFVIIIIIIFFVVDDDDDDVIFLSLFPENLGKNGVGCPFCCRFCSLYTGFNSEQ